MDAFMRLSLFATAAIAFSGCVDTKAPPLLPKQAQVSYGPKIFLIDSTQDTPPLNQVCTRFWQVTMIPTHDDGDGGSDAARQQGRQRGQAHQHPRGPAAQLLRQGAGEEHARRQRRGDERPLPALRRLGDLRYAGSVEGIQG